MFHMWDQEAFAPSIGAFLASSERGGAAACSITFLILEGEQAHHGIMISRQSANHFASEKRNQRRGRKRQHANRNKGAMFARP